MSVIVAEPDPDLAEVFTATLNRSGHPTRHATSGPQALKLVTERRPQLVVLDDRMPGAPGLDVARLLRAHPGTADLPLVMVASGPLPAARGVVDRVMTKPISSRALLRAVEDLLATAAPPPVEVSLALTDQTRLRAAAACLNPPPHTVAALDSLLNDLARVVDARMAAVTLTLDTSVVLLACAGGPACSPTPAACRPNGHTAAPSPPPANRC